MAEYAVSENMDNKILYYNHILTQDIIDLLNNSLTNYSITILKQLYHSPQMQQKTLAANLHTSPNSLSNMLSKLENIYPRLLNVEKIGRSKYYSLTEVAELYISQEILPRTTKIHAFSPPHEDALTQETLALLSHFQKSAGAEWFLVLDDMLSGAQCIHTNADELNDLYADFISNIKQLKILGKLASIHEIHDALGQPILVKRLDSHVNAELKRHYALEPLLELEKRDFDKSILLMDYIFHKIKPSYSMPVLPPSFKEIPVSQEQYANIYLEFTTMIEEMAKYQGNTVGAATYWKDIYLSNSVIFYLIAEKCHSISAPESSTLRFANVKY